MLRKLCVVLLCVSTGAGGGHVCLRAILPIFRQFHSDFMKSMFFFVCMFVKSWCLNRLQSLAVFFCLFLCLCLQSGRSYKASTHMWSLP